MCKAKRSGKRGVIGSVLGARHGERRDEMVWYMPWSNVGVRLILAFLSLYVVLSAGYRPFSWCGWRYEVIKRGWPVSEVCLMGPEESVTGEIQLPDSFWRGFTQWRVTEVGAIALTQYINIAGEGPVSVSYKLKRVTLPHQARRIGACAFRSCQNLETVLLPETLETIGLGAFQFCSSLCEIQFPDSLETIGDSAFEYCTALKQIRLPAGLQTVDIYAFGQCTALRQVYLGDGIQDIEYGAFSGCASLESIRFPDGLEEIGDEAFSGCASLERIELPEGVKKVGAHAFAGCDALRSVIIPKDCQIGEGAFPEQAKIHYR